MTRAAAMKNDHQHFLPPPVTPSGEEPIAAGGRQINFSAMFIQGMQPITH